MTLFIIHFVSESNLGNCGTNLRQIHREDVFGPSLGGLRAVTRDKTGKTAASSSLIMHGKASRMPYAANEAADDTIPSQLGGDGVMVVHVVGGMGAFCLVKHLFL